MKNLVPILILLFSSVFVVSIFKRIKVSAVLGYLVAGGIIGPHVLGLVENMEQTKVLGEVGILFFLFMVGLELSYERLKVLRTYIFGMGAAQVFFTTLLIGGVIMSATNNVNEAVLIGMGISLSSTAVVLQLLAEKGEMTTRFGRVTFSILIFQDLAVVLILVFLRTIGKDANTMLWLLGETALKAAIVFSAIALLGRFVLRPVYHWIAVLKNPELLMATTIIVILGTSLLTHYGGLSTELGAFLAGIMLASTEYKHQVEADIEPFRGILLGIFFMTVGMSIDLGLLMRNTSAVLSVMLLTLTLKGIVLIFLGGGFNLGDKAILRIAFLLAPGSEMLFVVLTPALEKGLLSEVLVNVLFLSNVISMAITPILNGIAQKLCHYFGYTNEMAVEEAVSDSHHKVIIVGFGRVGEMVGAFMQHHMISYIALDSNLNRVMYCRTKGLPVFLGDGQRIEMLRAVGAHHAQVIVVTIDKKSVAINTALMIQRHFPNANVCVRVYDEHQAEKLRQAGVHVVLLEIQEHGLQMIASALKNMEYPEEEVTHLIDDFRTCYVPSKHFDPELEAN